MRIFSATSRKVRKVDNRSSPPPDLAVTFFARSAKPTTPRLLGTDSRRVHVPWIFEARATSVHKSHIEIDKPWEGSHNLPYDYLVIATGTLLAAPSMMPFDSKAPAVKYIQDYQEQVQAAEHVTIVGGGAVGVQMALDIREIYPGKQVTVVHSRGRLMQVYHEGLDRILREAFAKQGIRLITGTRAVVPEGGFPKEASKEEFEVRLNNGDSLHTNFVIPATGQKPNTALLSTLPSTTSSPLINPSNGFLHVRPTLQLSDPAYPHIFAVGDIADSGAHKAARPGAVQSGVVARNVLGLIERRGDGLEGYVPGPAGIHLSLGLRRNIVFRNPNVGEGETEPTVIEREE
ncbi:hypothetical protein PRZ48_013591 [Zasmidium cellare]|uniref:FAD/NAD(P)-binding domain-containing protein n=1 Tax=Zasmidium cellare TaxID=395010 RepID=A0ABR0E1F8_ZASCE|nr:hypothetical protein PRZ48_013591 [Zasmidium cellare]